MTIEEALYAHLTSDANVTALMSTRLYPGRLPQDPTYPAARYSRVTGPRAHGHDGPHSLAWPRFQFDCFGTTYAQAKALLNAIRVSLDGFSGVLGGSGGVAVGGIICLNDLDDFGPAADVHRATLDVRIFHTE